MPIWPRTRDGLLWGCALAILFVGIDLLLAFDSARTAIETPGYSTFALFVVIGQLVPLAVWTAFGRAPFLVRSACLAVGACSAFSFQASRNLPLPYLASDFQLLTLGQLILVLPLPCFLLRLGGFEFFEPHRAETDLEPNPSRVRSAYLVAQVVAWGAGSLWVGLVLYSGVQEKDLLAHHCLPALFGLSVVGAIFLPEGTLKFFSRCLLPVFVVGFFFLPPIWLDSGNFVASVLGRSLEVMIPVGVLLFYYRLGFRLVRTELAPAASAAQHAVVVSAVNGAGSGASVDSPAQVAPAPAARPIGPWSAEAPTEESSQRPRQSDLTQNLVDAVLRIPPLAILLVVVLMALDCAGALMRAQNIGRERQPLFLMLLLSQNGIIAVWTAFGSPNGLIRLPLAIVGIAILVMASAQVDGSRMADRECIVAIGFFSMATITTLVLLGMRLIGIRLLRSCPQKVRVDNPAESKRFQFSMLHISIAMAEFGVLAALAKFLYETSRAPPAEIIGVVFQGAILALLVLLASWIALAQRWPNVRLLVAAALLYGSAWVFGMIIGGGGMEIYGIVLLLETFIVAQLAVFRVCGYHFEFRRRRRAAAPQLIR